MPEITFRTITQISFTLNLEASETILDIKKRIEAEKGDDYAVELQKLIYNGKVLEDTNTVEQVGIDPSKFVVVMLGRKKAPEAPAVPAAAATTPVVTQETPTNPTPAVSTPAAPPSGTLTADQNEKIETVTGMGYTREQALRALNLANWDANGAVNLLLNGSDDFDIPPQIAAPEMGEEEEERVAGLEEIAALPQFEELRNMIRANPASLPDLMRDIAQANPQLMEVINQNQSGFLQMIAGGGSGGGGSGGAGGAAGPQPGQQVIRLTPAEAAAVQRIKDMGLNIPDSLIIEAYLACDKNEEMAVSYIFENMEQYQNFPEQDE